LCRLLHWRQLATPSGAPPSSSQVKHIRYLFDCFVIFGVAELRSCRLVGAELCGAGVICFLALAGTKRLPDLLMANFAMVTSPPSPYSLVVDVKAPPGRWLVCTSFVVKEVTSSPKRIAEQMGWVFGKPALHACMYRQTLRWGPWWALSTLRRCSVMRRCKSQRARRWTRLLTLCVGVVFEERLYNRHNSCVRAHTRTLTAG
jgi:hypothetical protein